MSPQEPTSVRIAPTPVAALASPKVQPRHEPPQVTKADLLTLKKQVMEEIRLEIEEQERAKYFAAQKAEQDLIAKQNAIG